MIPRREFITLLGGATAAWPLAARAQQPAMPVIGYLEFGSPEQNATLVAAFRNGLSETGFVEGRNVAIEYRWAEVQYDRLSDLVSDLVRRRVAVIVAAAGSNAASAAKAATNAIPIVFRSGGDPVQSGLVVSLNRPGGNVTGITSIAAELGAKRLGLLHQLLPRASCFAVLIDPNARPPADGVIAELQTAASAIGRRLEVLYASTNAEIDAAFATLVQKGADALLIAPNQLFFSRRVQVVTGTIYHRVPAIFSLREYAGHGGLMSYGTRQTEVYRLTGVYVGRILKGEKPSDLPVMQPTKFEFVINLQTARLLGIEVPPTLLALADEVLE